MKRTSLLACGVSMLLVASPLLASNVARELKRMVGYTIIGAARIDKIYEDQYGDKILKLDDGMTFKVSYMYWEPSSFSDVIIFAKRLLSEEDMKDYPGLPWYVPFKFKLLVEDEVYDAEIED